MTCSGADSSSLLTLGAVARRIAGLPVALLGCLRPLPHSGDLDRVTGVLEAAGPGGSGWPAYGRGGPRSGR